MSDISSGMEPSSPPPVIKKCQNPENWIQNKAKKKRNSGQAYQSRTGKEVAGRSIGPPCTCGCFDRIPVDVRQAIHKIFYEMGDWVLQNSYLQKHIKSQPVKRRRKPKDANNPGPHRSCTLTYTLSHAATTYSVCKKAFLSILALGRTRIVSALNSMTATGKSTPDMRGRHKPPNAVPIESARLASDHIDSFPTVMSHYSRAKSPKLKYLDPSLSVNTMHHLYSSWLVENHPGKKAVSQDYYRRNFRGKDLSFSPPNSDTCTTCDQAKNGIRLANETNNEQGKVALQESLDAHITQARIGQALMKQYGNIKEPDTRVITIDLQQTQPLPHLTTKRVQITAMDPSLQEIEEKVDDVECKAEEEFLYEEELSYPDSNAFGEGHSQSKKKQENDDTSFAQTYEKVKPMLKDLGVRSQVLHEKKLSVEEVRLKAEEARLNAFNKMASFFESAEDFLNSYSDMMRALSQGEGHGRRGPRSKGPQTVKED